MATERILIVDDEHAIRILLRMILEHAGYQVFEADTGRAALELLHTRSIDLVLLDIKMPQMDGMEALRKMNELPAHPLVIILSGHGSINSAIEATKLGAYDFLEKPPQKDRILLSISNALQSKKLKTDADAYHSLTKSRFALIGESPALKQIKEQVSLVAGTNASVLITGESGTGKEIIARSIHEQSARRDHQFVQVNCAAIPETLIENELFGHERGAFTGAVGKFIGKFEQADRGTLFLDEIGDMSLVTQAKVLRVLQDGEFNRVGGNQMLRTDVRVISATNKDLLQLLHAGQFREDLYFRLNVVPIKVPPLRERSDDISLLVDHFLDMLSQEHGISKPRISEQALDKLRAYHYPGNVRELKNVIERALILGSRDTILPNHIQLEAIRAAEPPDLPWLNAPTLREFKEESEKYYILAKLKEHKAHVQNTAKAIDTPRSNLYKKLIQYGIKTDMIHDDDADE